MHKAKFIKIFPVIFFLILLFQMVIFGLIEDYLLFKSDLENFILYCLGISIIITPPLFAGLVISFFFLHFPLLEKFHHNLLRLGITGILFGFVIYLFDVFIYKIQSVSLFFLFSVLLFIACYLLIRKHPDQQKITSTMQQVSNAVLVIAALTVIGLYTNKLLFRNDLSNSFKTKNVVVVVLDGLGSQFLSPYHPEASTPEFEKIAGESRLFTNIRTNFTYTMGFFWAFYTGKKTITDPKENLLTLLQDKGVNIRWTAMHNGAVPDATQIPYKGLRSAFITQNFTWIPNFFGLDYNVFRYNQGLRGVPMGNREQTVYHLTNKIFPRENILETHVINEIEKLRQDDKPFFFLVHTNRFGDSIIPKHDQSMREIWDTLSEKDELRAKFMKQDYTYSEEDSWIVEKWKKEHKIRLEFGLKSLKKFYDYYKEKGWDNDTLLILTADHGYILDKGKVWYGYHHEEEVTRVPFLIHYRDLKGIDTRLGETIDISQTILDFFKIEKKLSRNAFSLISSNQKEYTTTLTNPSNIRKEYFLMIYTPLNKYILNLYRGQNSLPIKAVIENRFDTVPIERGFHISQDLSPKIRKEILEDFVIPIKKGEFLLKGSPP